MAAILRPRRWARQPSGLVLLDKSHAWGRTAEFVYVGGVDHELVSKESVKIVTSAQSSAYPASIKPATTKNGTPANAFYSDSPYNSSFDNYIEIGSVNNAVNMAAKPATWAVHAIRILPQFATGDGTKRSAFAERSQNQFGWGFGNIDSAGGGVEGLGLFVMSTTNDSVASTDAVTTLGEPYSFIATYPGGGAAYTDTKFWFNGKSRSVTRGYGNTAGTVDDRAGTLFIGRQTQWYNYCHSGYLFIVAGFSEAWGDGEAQAWDENPWQFLRHPEAKTYFKSVTLPKTEVNNTYNGSYAVRNAITFPTGELQFNVRSLVAATRTGNYKIASGVARSTVTIDYSVKGSAAKSLPQEYSMGGDAALTYSGSYAIKNVVGRTTTTVTYIVKGQAAKTYTADYVISNPIIADYEYGYDLGSPAVDAVLNSGYGILNGLDRSLVIGYDLKAEVVARLGVQYSVRNLVAGNTTLTVDYSILSTLIATTYVSTYDVRRNVGRSSNPVYDIRNVVSLTLTCAYPFAGTLLTDLNGTYAIRNTVDAKMGTYGLGTGSLIYGPDNLIYGIENLVYGSNTGAVTYAIQELAGLSLYSIYSMRGQVAKSLGNFYNVAGASAKTYTGSYNIRTSVASELLECEYFIGDQINVLLTCSYAVLGQQTATRPFSYAIRGLVAKSSPTFSYILTGYSAVDYSGSYDVRNVVTNNLLGYWNNKTLADRTLPATYAVKHVVDRTRTGSFDVQNALVATLNCSFAVRGTVEYAKAFGYKINLPSVEESYTSDYEVHQLTARTLSGTYDVANDTYRDLVCSYNVIGDARSALSCYYDIDANNSKYLSCHYDVIGEAVSDLDCVYSITGEVSRRLILVSTILCNTSTRPDKEFLFYDDECITILERNEAFDVPQRKRPVRPNPADCS